MKHAKTRNLWARTAIALLAAAISVPAFGAEAVILKGGARIDLKEPPVQQGNNALLTRTDGTLFSVPMSEVDWKATAALKSQKPEAPKPAAVAPPSAPADAVRTGREGKAKVKVTDADVGHQAEPQPSGTPGNEKKGSQMPANSPRVEVLDYTQQKQGDQLVVTGQLQNPGTLPATNVRLAVTARGEDGVQIASSAAVLSNGTIEGGKAVSFSASLPVGDKIVAELRFSPQWWSPPPPPPSASGASGSNAAAGGPAGSGAAAPAGAAPAAAPAAASKPPGPAPTPYGQGLLYAAPAASAPTEAPADGKTGYIPGASSPDNQPKPPQ